MVIKDENSEQNYRVTVIVTSFNRRQFLLRALNSVLIQSLERSKYDIIVTKNFYDEKIDSILSKNNVKSLIFEGIGIGPRIIDSLSEVKTDIVCFLEDDDIFEPDKLKIILNEFVNKPNLIYIKNNIIYQNPNGGKSKEVFNNDIQNLKDNEISGSEEDIIKYFKLSLYFNLSSVGVKRELLEHYKHIISKMILSVDFALFVCSIDSKKQMLFLSDRLSVYTVHSSYSLPSTAIFQSFLIDRMKVSSSYFRDAEILLNSFTHSDLTQLLFANYIIWKLHINVINESTHRKDFFEIMFLFFKNRKVFKIKSFFIYIFLSFLCIFKSRVGRIFYYLYFKCCVEQIQYVA